MSFYADLHVHSRYARATSRNADLVELAWWARRKGITVLGTGDFTHPVWFEELTRSLVPAEPGLYRLRDELDRAVVERLPSSCRGPLRLLLEVEVSTAFHRDGRARRMHHLLYVP
ncbi:MAG TPA: AAA family ATPase, partial [Actinomycetota bacterium]|nr:AAA family ATPase [Actinomycetota bacterium]